MICYVFPSCCRQLSNIQGTTLLFGMPQIVLRLLVEPALRRSIKRDRKPNSHLRADPGSSIEDGRQRFSTYTQAVRRFGYGNAERFQAQLSDDLARVRGIMHQHFFTSVIVLIVDYLGITFIKPKCDTPVATDSYRPDPTPITAKLM